MKLIAAYSTLKQFHHSYADTMSDAQAESIQYILNFLSKFIEAFLLEQE